MCHVVCHMKRKYEKKEKKIEVRYPSRVDPELIAEVNKLRKEQGITWPFLTERFLRTYLRTKNYPI